ncbi:ABC transporter permease [Reichenbachiella ulvae]|uniref:ABC transporter permease n=1 Tax=Reichenbachiella ulvae TaxID=2980104 RepID=A0ABT3CQV4_9BACT|nr:ABC transporter permease [Reichenbachiella ulvae]MCV9386075.1 ABC transporter permease [Reichenbachiella ulvae]
MRQLFTFIKKEFKHVFRDQKTLLLLFGLPIVQIILFGFALTNEIKDASLVVVDYSKDEATQKIIEKFRTNSSFKLEESILGTKEIEEAFKEGKVKMALIFPADFENDLIHENRASIQLIADATDPNTATTLVNHANTIIRDFRQELATGRPDHSIAIDTRNIYNPELKGTTNFVPGVMALVLLLICVLMTSVSIVKEKESGTMEILLVSPFNPFMVIIAKAVPYLLLSIVNLSVILFLSVYLLDMPINGSIALLFAVSILLIMTALSLGLLISNSTDSQQAAMLISLMGMLLPTMMFTGFLFPLENMPWPLQLVANVVPSKWYYIIVKDVMIKGLGFSAIWKETLILTGMTAFLLFVSIKKFKIRLS